MIHLWHMGVFVNHLKQGILLCLAGEGYRELLYLSCSKLNISLITLERNALDCILWVVNYCFWADLVGNEWPDSSLPLPSHPLKSTSSSPLGKTCSTVVAIVQKSKEKNGRGMAIHNKVGSPLWGDLFSHENLLQSNEPCIIWSLNR